MRNEKLIHTRPDTDLQLKKAYLPRHTGDNKYVEKMVPGYTGNDNTSVANEFQRTNTMV